MSYIPSPWRRLTANHEHVTVEGSNVDEVLDALNERYPGFDMLVYDSERRIPRHINIYVNNQEDTRPRRHRDEAARRRPAGR